MSVSIRLALVLSLCFLLRSAFGTDLLRAGQPLQEYIETLREQGLAVIYSSDLVLENFELLAEPASLDPEEALRAALRPYQLMLTDGPSGSLLITRNRSNDELPPTKAITGKAAGADADSDSEQVTEMIVTASNYNLEHKKSGSHTFIDQELIENLPDIGGEPVRAVLRLPGIANGGVSTRNHVRGGLDNEQLFLVDGLRLYEPYHLKDFHSVATIVNQGGTDGIGLYAAGYQARYGDRMSGVVDISLVEPPSEAVTEVGVSSFNTSLMSMGRFGGHDRGDWLVSVRRGNLGMVAEAINSDLGSPRFQDLLARIGWQLNDRSYFTINLLTSYDKIKIATTNGRENAEAKYLTGVGWVKLQTDWSDLLSSATIMSVTNIDNTRLGSNDNPGVLSGRVDESNDFLIMGLQQDWQFNPEGAWSFSSGFNARRLEANYRYDSTLVIESPFDQILDNQPLTTNSVRTSPNGNQYAVYLESRWQPVEALVVDLGVRWDQQRYTIAENDDQISPRINVMYRLDEKTVITAGFGQFYQAQEINELQVSAGVDEFYPAQRAQHLIASLSHRFDSGLSLSVELYQKKYYSLMPRYENVFDPLVLLPELQIDRLRIDANNATAKGAELTLSGERGQLLWWASYTWADIEDHFETYSVNRSWDQTHTVKGGLNWEFNRWNFSAAGVIRTGWPKTELQSETITNPDGSKQLAVSTASNGIRYAIFSSVDVRASRRIDVSRGELTAFVEVTNLYNRKNRCCTEYTLQTDGNGNDFVDAEKSNWLPFVPSLGINWRF